MSKFVVPSGQPDAEGNVLTITPESAGWSYIGLKVYRLRTGEKISKPTGQEEVCIVLLQGWANVRTDRMRFDRIGERMSLFEEIPPYSVYVPWQDQYEIEALTDLEFAVCTAPGAEGREARLIPPGEVQVESRGSGNMLRRVHNILPEQKDAASLLVVEVFTPNGHWSSYPPHKHDEDNLPHESFLEEIYYHRTNPDSGFAFQRVYTDDRSIDEALTVASGDAVLVPRGYHPVSAAPGYDLYYLNVMAGPVRTWKFHNDPAHEWLFRTTVREEDLL